MCFHCGGGMWPWAHQTVQLAPAPGQKEEIWLDANPGFYPDYRTGIHPPGPVYTSNQPADYQWYYNQPPLGSVPTAAGYWHNNQWIPTGTLPLSSCMHSFTAPTSMMSADHAKYYRNLYNNLYERAYDSLPPNQYIYGAITPFGITQYPDYSSSPYAAMFGIGGCSPFLGGPMAIPTLNHPATMTAQAAAAAAANAALAAMPQAPGYFPGGSPAEIAAQQAILAQMYGVGGAGMANWMYMFAGPKPPPTQLAPYKPADGQQFWCKETDGSWTLRTQGDIAAGEVAPGHWERHASSGYFYWVRQ